MSADSLLFVAAKATTLVLGGLIASLAYRAYRRTGVAALRSLAVGFSLVTAGAAVGGLLHQVTGVGFRTSLLAQSLFTAAGFVVLAYSLYEPEDRQATSYHHGDD